MIVLSMPIALSAQSVKCFTHRRWKSTKKALLASEGISPVLPMTSGLHSETDIVRAGRHVSNVPISDDVN